MILFEIFWHEYNVIPFESSYFAAFDHKVPVWEAFEIGLQFKN